MSKKILLVEDDEELADLVSVYLTKNNFMVEMVHDGELAVAKIRQRSPDIVILDVMLPGKNGMEVCREVRQYYQGPILMLTALDDDLDQMLGLELGADDYIVKPIKPRLLLTRIRTVLRRMGKNDAEDNSIINAGDLCIDTKNRLVTVQGNNVELTSAEFELLILLSQEIGQVVDRSTIVQELRGFDYDGFDRSIDRRVSRLRKKLSHGSNIDFIKTIRGKGYQLCSGGNSI